MLDLDLLFQKTAYSEGCISLSKSMSDPGDQFEVITVFPHDNYKLKLQPVVKLFNMAFSPIKEKGRLA